MPAHRKVTDAVIETCGQQFVAFGHEMTEAAVATIQHKIGWPISRPTALKWARFWIEQKTVTPPEGISRAGDPAKANEIAETFVEPSDDELDNLTDAEKNKQIMRQIFRELRYRGRLEGMSTSNLIRAFLGFQAEGRAKEVHEHELRPQQGHGPIVVRWPGSPLPRKQLYVNGKPVDQWRGGDDDGEVLELSSGDDDDVLSAEDNQYGEIDDDNEPALSRTEDLALSDDAAVITSDKCNHRDKTSPTDGSPQPTDKRADDNDNGSNQDRLTDRQPIAPELRIAVANADAIDRSGAFYSEADDLPLLDRPAHRQPEHLRRLS